MDETQFPDSIKFNTYGWHGDNMILQISQDVRIHTSWGTVTIPDGFITDGLSIPKFAWSIVGPTTGRAFLAGLLHDYLYSKESSPNFNVDRKVADELFLEAMFNLGIGFRRNIIYRMVRIFGGRYYKKK